MSSSGLNGEETILMSRQDLKQAFEQASLFIRSAQLSASQEEQLELYALFKQATIGPCNSPKPGFFMSLSAEAYKWKAWNDLGNMSADEAMRRYIINVIELENRSLESDAMKENSSNPFGPVFSRMKILDSDVEDPDGNDEKGDADQKEEGDCNKLQDSEEINLLMGLIQKQDRETVQSLIKENPSLLFQKNSRGMTSLHAACDFGEDLELISWLIDQGSEINAQDLEGQTALHYACLCEYEKVIQLLVSRGADVTIKTEGQETALQLCPKSMRSFVQK